MDRETKKVTTPHGKQEIELKTYITGGEKRAIQVASVQEATLEAGNQIKGLKLKEAIGAAEDAAFRIIVVSIDGKKDGDMVDGKPFFIVGEILNMREADYKFILRSLNEITRDGDFEEKKI